MNLIRLSIHMSIPMCTAQYPEVPARSFVEQDLSLQFHETIHVQDPIFPFQGTQPRKHDEFGFLVVLHHVIRFNFTTAVGESSKISWFGFIDYTISISKRIYKNSSGSDYKVVYYEDCKVVYYEDCKVVYYSPRLKVVYVQFV
ncbi:hypothetical protein CEXT_663841 [Caerostris extrusa]|uniref:Uncharacterized protein n=1 Tax=Caerostris extrusa TaxID=172846 RepID=A0AAV4M562_CAEEX|nr:hypothetical protein CEXT_663841 [Caerostris extrusa]